ncbi:sulfatase [Rufibacter radiotolerans]|uniref:Sulfatase n=1 Tax=Rufibacter radiotolerans TaxID=1379910 RepID=A0A0H4VQF3_9BACT|nr:sulfatase-like hydrolase/transferase [Rufibacter radiotolerans]AKQ46162.1 sulfatase [Rufibacter radiotolerans]
MKRIFRPLILLVLISVCLPFSGAAQTKPSVPQKKQPNIIFILTDDLGYGDLGVFFQKQRQTRKDRSEPWAYTPNLDKMAAQGAVLAHHYAGAPVCAPSRASILLGLSQGHANVRDNQFDKALEDNHTMASVLKKAGYATAAVGKWGLQGKNKNWPGHPLNRGFDYYLGYIRHGDGHEHYPKEGVYRGAKEVYQNRTEIAATLDKCYTADLWTAASKKWIIDQAKGKENPFFLYLAYDTPHAVLELPTQAYPAGGGLKGGLQWTGKPGQMINTASGTVDSWTHPDYAHATYDHDKNPATPEIAWPDVYKRYATSVRRIDDAIGDLLQLLKDLKIDENTLVVFSSDNGPSLESYLGKKDNNPDFFNSFGPFDGVKRDVWEGGVRMPALAWWPGHIPANTVVKTPNASHDWLPTFTHAAGVPAPARTDGVSLLPSLTGKGNQQESLVYVEYENNGSTPTLAEFHPAHQKRKRGQMQLIRLGDYVGVRYDIKAHSNDFEIYNVVKDPQEVNNLAKAPGMEKLQQQMKDKVLQARRPDPEAPRPYDQELMPAVVATKTKPGLSWKAFAGDFLWVPEITSLQATATGQTPQPMGDVGKPNQNLLFFQGYINAPADGTYTFYLTTDGGALLRLHEATVLDADYGYKVGQEIKGELHLKAGLHPVRLYYTRQPGSTAGLDLQWSGPGISKSKLPASVFFQDAPAL